jgi:hypothetical protein
MATPTTKTELLKTQAAELVKQYIEYDAGGRPTHIYTAATFAVDGDACTLTEYEYLSPTSNLITKRRESYSTWSAAYDI